LGDPFQNYREELVSPFLAWSINEYAANHVVPFRQALRFDNNFLSLIYPQHSINFTFWLILAKNGKNGKTANAILLITKASAGSGV
jgi:hypothetical protein